MGAVGVLNSDSPQIKAFFETGDPGVFEKPGHKNHVPV